MHRIDTSTAQKDKFGAGKAGFTSGNPQTGVPATEVSSEILDAMQEEICAVVEGSGLSLDKTNNSQLLLAIKKIASSRYFSAGNLLPTSNIGPIWHDDYADWMTWQTFNQNGANYTGYASRLIGSLLLDTQPTPRSGYIKSGVQNLGKETYAALRAWAMHNGRMVAPGVWQAGAIQCADNADGTTFRVFDVRAEFFRALDDGRGVDAGRVFGSPQTSANLSHIHVPEYAFSRRGTNPGGVIPSSSAYTKTYFEPTGEDGQLKKADNGTWGSASVGLADLPSGGTEARPRNSALLATIKY